MSFQDEKKKHVVSLAEVPETEPLSAVLTEDLTQLLVTIDPSVKSVHQASRCTLSPQQLDALSFPPCLQTLLARLAELSQSSSTSPLFIDPSVAQSRYSMISSITLEQCLDQYFRQEVLDLTVEYMCESCHQVVDVMRETVMDHTPAVMIIHLMRFAYDQCVPVKIFEDVKYPIHVSIHGVGEA